MPRITGTATTNSIVWSIWTGTSTAATYVDVWPTWVESTATSVTTVTEAITSTGATIWGYWCENGTTHVIHEPRARPYAPPVLTPEQAEAQRVASEAATARYAEASRLRAEAEARAELLLLENLSLIQRLQFAETKAFVVEGRNGRRFRIRHGRSGNVDVVGRDGRVVERLCAHPALDVPNCDTMLAQKLMLEDDEALFMRIANKHGAGGGLQVLEPLH